MFNQYFGQYLLRKDLISQKQLELAFEQQQSTRIKLGVLAINEGYMTTKQIEEVHTSQMKMDKKFGEIAMELNYLTAEQLETLLSSQKKQHLLLGQALIDNHSITIDQFSDALSQYKHDHGLSDDQFAAVKEGDIDALVSNLLKIDDVSNKQELTEYLSLFSKNIIRFIDSQVYIEIAEITEDYSNEWIISQEIQGERPLYTAIAADEKVFLQIASKYAQEEIDSANSLAIASVGEFLNLHNGIYLVNMSDQGIELDMTPQEAKQNATLDGLQSGYRVTINLSNGKFDLLLSNQL